MGKHKIKVREHYYSFGKKYEICNFLKQNRKQINAVYIGIKLKYAKKLL